MANTHDARRLSKRAFRRRPALMRVTALIFMLLSTLLLALPVLPGFSLPDGLAGRLMIAGLFFLCCLAGLLLNGPAVAAARGKETRVFENLHFPRWIITLVLAAVPAAILGCSPLLVSAFRKYIDQPLTEYVKTLLPDGFFSIYLALGAFFIAFLCALTALAWSVFTRQAMIYLFERRGRLQGRAFVQMMRSGLLNAFSPIRIWFSSFFWFLLMAVLGGILLIAAGFITVGWQEGMSLTEQLLYLLNNNREIPFSLLLAGLAASHIWIAGLGFIFWPRYQLKRVYYQRMLMNENGMEINSAHRAEETA